MTAASPLADFFATYQRTLESDPAATLVYFADTFLALGPDGAKAVPAAAFAPALDKRKQFFDQLGCQPAELVSVEETPLDPRYALARTRWRMTFVRPGHPDESLSVDSTFLVDLEAQRILVYLAHQDIFALLRQRGILTD